MAYYRAPKKRPADPHPLPEGMAGIDLLLGVCDDLDELCLVALCGLMGLRVNEAVTVPASAVDISHPGQYVLHVVDYAGKGRKPRDLPIYHRPLGYIMARAAQEGFSREPLVRMDRDQARRRIKLLGRRAGLSREISSHDLRATFATDMYERTKDMLAVKEWLGHSNIETTVGYCGLSMSKMRAAVA